MVKEPSVFELLRFYRILYNQISETVQSTKYLGISDNLIFFLLSWECYGNSTLLSSCQASQLTLLGQAGLSPQSIAQV